MGKILERKKSRDDSQNMEWSRTCYNIPMVWKSKSSNNPKRLYEAILATDAMELEKHVHIAKTGYVIGVLENLKIDDKKALLFSNGPE